STWSSTPSTCWSTRPRWPSAGPSGRCPSPATPAACSPSTPVSPAAPTAAPSPKRDLRELCLTQFAQLLGGAGPAEDEGDGGGHDEQGQGRHSGCRGERGHSHPGGFPASEPMGGAASG